MRKLTEFISPFEEGLHVIFMGDNMTPEFMDRFKAEFNNTRKLIDGLDDITYHYYTTIEVFKQKPQDITMDNICIMIMDDELSNLCLKKIAWDVDDMDPLDIMLMERYISTIFQDKFIFNITKVSDTLLEKIIDPMDFEYNKFEYILTDHHFGVIIK